MKTQKLMKPYDLGTKVRFENLLIKGTLTGVISGWSIKCPANYEVTCENGATFFIHENSIVEVIK